MARLLLLLLLLAPLADGASSALSRRSLQEEQDVLLAGDTVVNGVLNLHTSEGVAACQSSCKRAFAEALGVLESSVGCLCPITADNSTTTVEEDTTRVRTRRNLRHDGNHHQQRHRNSVRRLAELETGEPVFFTARVEGGLDGGATAVEKLSESGWSTVASAFGVQESEVEITTLTVTPPSSDVANETLTVITDFFDASDIDIVTVGDNIDWAGGGRGAALFLALLVLVLGTCCCGGLVALGLLWKARKDSGSDTKKLFAHLDRKSSITQQQQQSGGDDGGSTVKKFARLDRKSSRRQPAVDTNPRRSHSGSDVLSPSDSAFGLVRETGDVEETPLGTAAPGGDVVVPAPHDDRGIARGGDEAGGEVSRKAVASSAPEDDGGPVGVVVPRGAVAAVGGEVDGDGAVPQNVSMQESGGTNPLYKSVAPYSLSAQGSSQAEQTPGRSRLSTFLGNATPARLRRLAGRMTPKSPALSGSSRRSRRSGTSKHSRSGSSSSSRKHRRQGTFPGAYSQRNSSELDHQRPPADPVYTFMIKTIAAKGFKFMTTTEIAFCAMRMYSHFRRTEGNYKRLTVMQNAENVPPVYEIIWRCDGVSDQNPQGASRFFSSTSGTDAEQQKSLLACLLALSWDGSPSSRKTLHRALTPTRPSKVPSPEDIFWDEFKDNTDALSGDDEMVAVARVVLLIAESANQPGQDETSSTSSAAAAAQARAASGEQAQEGDGKGTGIDHGDIMQALSGAHLREIGIAIKEARPGWQEAHVQLVSVLLVIAYLEEGAKNTLPGGKRPDPLSSLEWVNLLTPEALDAFLVEKMEARRTLVELDLEPSGLVIKHDDDGEVERVEPANSDKKNSGSWIGSRGHGHSQILPKSSGRTPSSRGSSKRDRSHRRNRSMESTSTTSSKPSPVVITTVLNRKASRDKKRGGGRGGDTGSVDSAERDHIRTVSQQRPAAAAAAAADSSSLGGKSSPSNAADAPPPPPLTIDAEDFAVRVPARGSSVRSGLARGTSPSASQASSVVTRVYAPSSVDDQGQYPARAGASWAVEDSDGRRSPSISQNFASPTNKSSSSAMSQVSIAGSRFNSSPTNNINNAGRSSAPFRGSGVGSAITGVSASGGAEAMTAAGSTAGSSVVPLGAAASGLSQDLTGLTGSRPRSPSAFSEAGPSEAEFSDAASRFEMSHQASSSRSFGNVGSRAARGTPALQIEPPTPNSAAGSRFDTSSPASATTFTSRVGLGSPTAVGGGRRGVRGAPLTGTSMASSMRSDGGSSFFKNSAAGESQRSMDSRGGGGVGSASATSWDEDDLQNMGTRWLADRAYNQQFDEQK